MITKFIIKRRNQKDTWDVKPLVTNIKYITDMDYSAGELDFDLVEVNDGFSIHNGDIVMFNWDHKPIFFGYVFKYELQGGTKYSITAYDKLRYLKNNDSIVFPANNLGQRFNTICGYLGLKNKIISMPNHKLKAEIADNKSYFSMLKSGIDATKRAGDGHYFLHDNYGTVELRKYPHYKLKMIIGDKHLVTDYSFTRSIEQSFNVVKVVKSSTIKGKKTSSTVQVKNKKGKVKTKKITKTGKGHKKLTTESATGGSIDEWGKLVYVDQTSKKLNDAQLKQRAIDLLKQKNKQQNQLKINTIGNIYLVAGNEVTIKIKDLKDIGVGTKKYLISKATHNFGYDYNVEMELRV